MAIFYTDTGSFGTLNVTQNFSVTGSINISGSSQSSVDNFSVHNMLEITGSALITGSLIITGSIKSTQGFIGSLQGTASYYNEIDPIFIAKSASLATTGSNIFRGNQTITGSLNVTLGITGSFSGSIAGYVANTQTSSFVQNSQTSSFVTNSQTSSFVTNSQTSSFVTTSSFNNFTSSVVSTSSFNNFTSSVVTTSSFNNFTSSVVSTSSFNSYTSSVVTTSSFNNFTSSIVTTSSFNTFTSSVIINSQTGSFVTTSSFNTYTSSVVTTSSFNSITSSFATTSSNTFNGNQIISGSGTAGILQVVTGSTSLMYVSASGNVGIGTATPAYRLDVNGTSNFSSTITGPNTTITSSLIAHSTQIKSGQNNSTAFAYRLVNGGADTIPRAAFGNLSSATVEGVKTYTFDSTYGLVLIAGNTNSNIVARASIDVSGSNNGLGTEAGDILFRTQTGGTTMTEKMRIFGGGNVAIGTSTDNGYKLYVNGTGYLNGSSTINGNLTVGTSGRVIFPGNTNGNRIEFGNSGNAWNLINGGSQQFTAIIGGYPNGTSTGTRSYIIDYTYGLVFSAANSSNITSTARASIQMQPTNNTAGSEAGDLTFLTQIGGTAMSERMRITASGSVAIGKTTANATLDISGSAIITGSLNVTGSSSLIGNQTLVGTKTITGSVFISGSKTIIGDNTVTGSWLVSGSTILNGNTTITGSLTTTGTVNSASAIEISYLSGSTSNIQNQLNGTPYYAYQAFGSAIKSVSLTVPNLNSITAAASLSDRSVRFVAVYLPSASVITGIKWFQSTLGVYTPPTAGVYNGVGMYSISAGTLTCVASSSNNANIWSSSLQTLNTWTSQSFGSTYSAQPGLYYIAMLYTVGAQTTSPAIGGGTVATNANVNAFDFANSYKIVGTLFGTTLPTSTAASAISANTNLNYAAYLY